MKHTCAKLAALVFIGFFITIVVIANRGDGGRWWPFIERIPYGDKIGHIGLIGTLALLCNLAIRPRYGRGLLRFITLTTLVLLACLTLEEISQAFQPHRTCDLFDWLADLVGLGLGQSAALMLRQRFFNC